MGYPNTAALATQPAITAPLGTLAEVDANGTQYWSWYPTATPPPPGSQTVPGNGGVWALLLPIAYSSAQLDQNSLIWSGHYGPETYVNNWSATASRNFRFQSPTYGDMTWVNQGGNAVGVGISAQCFTAPPGCTTATVGFSYIEDPVHAPAHFTLDVVDNTGAVVATSGALLPNGALQLATLPLAGLTPGAQYYPRITVNDVGQQSAFLLGGTAGGATPFHVTPTSGAGFFASQTFQRMRVDARTYERNCFPNKWIVPAGSYGGTLAASPFSDVEVITDAVSMAAEVWSDIVYSTRGFRVDVGGMFNQYVQPAAPGVGAQWLTFVLPAGVKRVRLKIGSAANATGTWFRSLCFPAGSYVQLAPKSNAIARQALYLGDSITVDTPGDGGITVSVGDRNSPSALGDQGVAEPTFLAFGGAALASNFVNTYQGAASFVESLPAGLTDIWIALGANDYLSATCTAAVFGTYYGYLLSALNTIRPNLRVFAQSPITETVEGANAVGSTLPQYRAAILAAANQATCTYVDGTSFGIVPATDLQADGIHLNDIGYAKWTQGINTWLQSYGGTSGTIQPPWQLLQQQVQSLQAAQFTDASVQARLRADQSVTLVAGAASAWSDMRIGATPSATQAIAGRRPTWFGTGGPNNRPYLHFVSASLSNMATAAIAGLTQPCMLIVVARYTVLGHGTVVDGGAINSGRISRRARERSASTRARRLRLRAALWLGHGTRLPNTSTRAHRT